MARLRTPVVLRWHQHRTERYARTASGRPAHGAQIAHYLVAAS